MGLYTMASQTLTSRAHHAVSYMVPPLTNSLGYTCATSARHAALPRSSLEQMSGVQTLDRQQHVRLEAWLLTGATTANRCRPDAS